MTLFLKCAQFRQTLLARILMGPPPLVPSFAPLSHMYASPGSLLYKKPSIWDKNSAFFAIFFRHWIKGFQWRFLYRNAREGCKYNAYHAEKVIFLWIFVKKSPDNDIEIVFYSQIDAISVNRLNVRGTVLVSFLLSEKYWW